MWKENRLCGDWGIMMKVNDGEKLVKKEKSFVEEGSSGLMMLCMRNEKNLKWSDVKK